MREFANVVEIADEIRRRLRTRHTGSATIGATGGTQTGEQVLYAPPDISPAIPPIEPERKMYRLSDLLCFQGAHYINHLYRSLAKYQADDATLQNHLEALDQERTTPLEILLSVAQSREANAAGTVVLGINDVIRRNRRKAGVPPVPPIDHGKMSYTASELLEVPENSFIPHLYRCLLKRDPDPEGAAAYSARWFSGDLSPDIIYDISRSPETVGKGVRVRGLGMTVLRRWLSGLPVVGRLFAIAANLAYLPELGRQFRVLQHRPLTDEATTLEMRLDSLRAEISALATRANHVAPVGVPNQVEIDAMWAVLDETVDCGKLNELLAARVTREELAQELTSRASLEQLAQLQESKTDRCELTAALLEQVRRIDDTEQRHVHYQQIHEMLLSQIDSMKQGQQAELRQIRDTIQEQTHRIDTQEHRQADFHYVDELLSAQTLRFETFEREQHANLRQTDERLTVQGQRMDAVEQRQADYHSTHETLLAHAKRIESVERHQMDGETTRQMLLAQAQRIETMELDRQPAIQQTHDNLLEYTRRIDSLEENKAEASAVTQLATSTRSMQKSLSDALLNLTNRQEEALTAIRACKLRILDIERRLGLVLEEARKRLPAPMEEQQIRAIAGYLDGIEASQYSDFENIFRGTREDIKNRQAVYLPYFERVPSGTTFPILDIGCGRGEFLEVLSESGRDATGVDANPTMVERCRELGLQVEHADAIDYLRRAKSGHYAVITTFHLVEHLPHPRVLALLDEALRALRPGGLLILETPNPQNLIVGSSTFYLDPTHLNPIPPAQLRFIVEARGFVNAEVKPMHPVPEYARPSGVEIPSYLAELLYGPQDYAVLAWKA